MKLLIYETTHHEVLPSMLDLSKIYFQSVTVFLTDHSYNHLVASGVPETRWQHARFYRKPPIITNRQFISSAFDELSRSNTHFHISTLHDNLFYVAGKLLGIKKIHLSMTVHSVNSYARYSWIGPRTATESAAKLILHRRIHAYRVLMPGMIPGMNQLFPGKPVVYLPAAFYEPGPQQKENDYFHIVIPGTVEPQRRDYEMVVRFAHKYLPALVNRRRILLTLLGDSRGEFGQSIVRQLRKVHHHNFELSHFDGYVSQLDYEQNIRAADVIWSPVKRETSGFRSSLEVYGITQASGVVGDIIRYGRPALLPSHFKIPPELNPVVKVYQSEDELVQHIHSWVSDNNKFHSWRAATAKTFTGFRKQNYQAGFELLMGLQPLT